MQNFELTFLGCSSATPTSIRNPTAQLLNIAERFFLIDCGEATQIQLRKYKLKFQRINNIFIKSLLAIILTSYIQPFEDGNKRTARLMGNAILLANDYCPLSYRSVDEKDYKKASLHVLELRYLEKGML